jgi:hypothetical protein
MDRDMAHELLTSTPEGYTAWLAEWLCTLYYDRKAETLDVWAGRNFVRRDGIDPTVK